MKMALLLWVSEMRVTMLRGPLAEDCSVTPLQSNTKRTDEKPLYHQWRGTSKLSVAHARGDTADELLETFAEGTSGFHHQRDNSRPFNHGQFGVLMSFLILPLLGRAEGAG
jgi:hypothetical protein